MRAIRLAVYELLRFRTPMQRAGLAFLLVVPLLYGGIYLWSNWDPYGRLSDVPVAVVNDDHPVKAEGRTVAAGSDLVSELKKNPLLGWRFTDGDEAAKGLKAGRYYAVITVPRDFSAKLTSGATGTPQQAAMSIRLDDANNFLVGIMAETVQSELERQVAAAAVATYFEVAFGKLGELHDGLADAASGAGELRDGLGEAKDGSGQLVQGLGAADAGTAELADGLGQGKVGTDALVTGLGKLKGGTGTLAGGLGELKAGTSRLAPGAAELSQGIHTLTDEAVPIAEDLSAALPGLADKAVAVSGDAADLTGLAAQLSGRIAKVTKAIDDWLHSVVRANPEIAKSPRFRDLREAIENLDGTIARRMKALAEEFPEVARDPGYARALKAAEIVDATLVSRLHRLADKHPELDNDPVWDTILRLADEIAARAQRIAREAAKVNDTTHAIARDARRFQKRDVPLVQKKLNGAVTGLKKLDKGGATVAAGVRTVDKGVGSALTGAGALDKGAGSALAGAKELDAGNAKLLNGANALHRGSGELLAGAQKLDSGNAQLEDGAGELASGLKSAKNQVPVIDQANQQQYAKTLAEPVNVSKSNAHPAGKYGRGLAPFFISIAMWVFGIVAFLLLRPVSGRILASRARAGTVAFAAWLPVMFMGGCSALVLFAVLNWGLGLKPVNAGATVGLMLLGMASFSAIVHVLRLALGAVGDALALALLILQLVSCGGLYPVETLPQPFRAIHSVIPMTYLVAPLRATISGGEPSHVVRDASILGAYLVAALALLVLIVRTQRRWSMARLKPELEL
ncbi:YhgE/Pip domain-containing protein [Actinomadura barringtoniae]|uniref:YhgE/Pip domain-containing protein n=1 Tax=Actinomadura barringtoniae TaxID=1427535 RepID=A0A939PQT0_9ACTN|nr:YhgE/Pip domain-containing protein [Actinomadura barringtoniae]MBO2454533.1 YhgE/Pip domain-containing protein [Actinomadura barringtoniae]